MMTMTKHYGIDCVWLRLDDDDNEDDNFEQNRKFTSFFDVAKRIADK